MTAKKTNTTKTYSCGGGPVEAHSPKWPYPWKKWNVHLTKEAAATLIVALLASILRLTLRDMRRQKREPYVNLVFTKKANDVVRWDVMTHPQLDATGKAANDKRD